MIKPTIGRVILFYSFAHTDGQQPWPALVAHVHSDRCINVGGFMENGEVFKDVAIPLLQDDDAVPASGSYATWMPYQIANAGGMVAKTAIEDPAPAATTDPVAVLTPATEDPAPAIADPVEEPKAAEA